MPIPVLKALQLSLTNIVHAENEQDFYFPDPGRQNNSSHFAALSADWHQLLYSCLAQRASVISRLATR